MFVKTLKKVRLQKKSTLKNFKVSKTSHQLPYRKVEEIVRRGLKGAEVGEVAYIMGLNYFVVHHVFKEYGFQLRKRERTKTGPRTLKKPH